jgi:SulP family sulfate permease
MLAAIESLLCAVVADGMIGGRHKSNMELVAQGVANCLSPLFGGIPATGAIARTAVSVKNGGRTPVAGMVHAIVLFLILLSAGPLAAHIPLAALAGILVVVAYHMSEWRSFQSILTGPRSDIAVLLTTFLLTVLVDLTVAVGVGMVLASFLFMRKMAELTQVRTLTHERDAGLLNGLTVPSGVEVYAINGSFFFGAANKVMEVERSFFKKPRALVLEMKGVLHLDASGLKVLDQIYKNCRQRGTRLILVGIHAQPMVAMQMANKYEEFGEDNFKGDLREAFQELQ